MQYIIAHLNEQVNPHDSRWHRRHWRKLSQLFAEAFNAMLANDERPPVADAVCDWPADAQYAMPFPIDLYRHDFSCPLAYPIQELSK